MKKAIAIILIILLAAAGAGVFIYLQKERVKIMDVLPQEVMAFIHFSDVTNNVQRISDTKFWKKIAGINYARLIEESNPKQQKLFQNIQRQVTSPANQQLLNKFFGREFALAVYPDEFDLTKYTKTENVSVNILMEDLFSNFFMVTRVAPDVQMTEFISRFLSPSGSNFETETKKYKDHTITIVLLKDINTKVAYTRIGDLLIMGVGEKAAQLCLDVFSQQRASLTQAKRYQQVQKRYLDAASMRGYLDLERLLAMFEGQSKDMMAFAMDRTKETETDGRTLSDMEETRRQMDEAFNNMRGLMTLGISSQWEDILQMNVHLFFDLNLMAPDLRVFYTECSPAGNETINFIPKETLGYQWSTCLNLEESWKQMKKEIERSKRIGMRSQEKEEGEEVLPGGGEDSGTYMTMIENDVIPAFADEMGGYFSDIKVGGMFPIPKLAVFIKVKDRSKAEGLLMQLKEHPAVNFQQEDYKGIAINYVLMAFGDIQPSYGYIGDYLVVAINQQLLEDSIDAYNDPARSLLASENFKEVNFGLTDQNTAVQFLNVSGVIKRLDAIIEWSNKWISSQEAKQKAFKAGSDKRLADMQDQVLIAKTALQEMQGRLGPIRDEIWELEYTAADTTQKQNELAMLENQIEDKKEEIELKEDQLLELEEIVEDYQDPGDSSGKRQLYLTEVLRPLLEGLGSIKNFGAKTTLDKKTISSTLFLKLTN